ncbi:nucleoside transporter [Magnaporthiopsis poae ATCC 64411]|uniref:Nucleoside transporter n=1 Tax=Magnaporthiopsis poae (strain ATCC 64411 / 73-15) TaxID=644358 RepID=A0A0C4DSW6_MAGP6|nr:nucleoside transporter [Magnaporthiopsis poae ATCC 64411]
MDRLRRLFSRGGKSPSRDGQAYEPLPDDGEGSAPFLRRDTDDEHDGHDIPFSWVEYSIFTMLGVAMLWAWNMFLAAAPYFATRFRGDAWLAANFQSAVLSASTVTNLGAMLLLANVQSSASYPFRITTALVMNVGFFSLLTASTTTLTAWATGLMQNGAFAFAAGFGRPEYMQAIMTGQAVAGVLPSVAQMVSYLAFSGDNNTAGGHDDEQSKQQQLSQESAGAAAFYYFLTAVVVSSAALAAFLPLIRRHNRIVEGRMSDRMAASHASVEEAERAARRVVGPVELFRKLHFYASAVFLCFTITMFFPVFTSKIVSVRSSSTEGEPLPPLFQPGAFIPLAFFFWNLGDLAGRVSSTHPFFAALRRRPSVLFGLTAARVCFLPLYMLCNVGGRGAVVHSDLFYLLLVQLPFGLTNGWLGSSAMMAASDWVEEPEREAAGAFMALCLVAGLAAGSVLSFTVSGI